MLLALYLFGGFYAAVTRAVRGLRKVVTAARLGDFTQPVPPLGRDELGQVAEALAGLLDSTARRWDASAQASGRGRQGLRGGRRRGQGTRQADRGRDRRRHRQDRLRPAPHRPGGPGDRRGELRGRPHNLQGTIAAAVEEQHATTAEISRKATEAATGSAQIAASITQIASAAGSTSQDATRSQQAAAELAAMSEQLQELLGHYRY